MSIPISTDATVHSETLISRLSRIRIDRSDSVYLSVTRRQLSAEPVDEPRVIAIASAAKELDEKRRAWLDPPGASEANLKKRTLINLYNERPTWLLNLHARLDRAVWDAYGWPTGEVPGEIDEEVVLERLLTLNVDRSQGKSEE